MRHRANLRPAPPDEHSVVLLREHRTAVEFARTLSTIFNPFLTATALFVIVSHAYTSSVAAFWALSSSGILFFTVAPLCVVVYLYITGRISDFEMSQRFERERVFAGFIIIYFLAAVTLTLTRAPVQLVAITWGYWWMAVATMIITRWWKISTHAFGITGPFVVLVLLFGVQALPYSPLILLVCWARIYLARHTLGQVLGGCALAAGSTLVFFKLFRLV